MKISRANGRNIFQAIHCSSSYWGEHSFPQAKPNRDMATWRDAACFWFLPGISPSETKLGPSEVYTSPAILLGVWDSYIESGRESGTAGVRAYHSRRFRSRNEWRLVPWFLGWYYVEEWVDDQGPAPWKGTERFKAALVMFVDRVQGSGAETTFKLGVSHKTIPIRLILEFRPAPLSRLRRRRLARPERYGQQFKD